MKNNWSIKRKYMQTIKKNSKILSFFISLNDEQDDSTFKLVRKPFK